MSLLYEYINSILKVIRLGKRVSPHKGIHFRTYSSCWSIWQEDFRVFKLSNYNHVWKSICHVSWITETNSHISLLTKSREIMILVNLHIKIQASFMNENEIVQIPPYKSSNINPKANSIELSALFQTFPRPNLKELIFLQQSRKNHKFVKNQIWRPSAWVLLPSGQWGELWEG